MKKDLSIDYSAIGQRLRAYRIGASLKAEDVADYLAVSRAAIYRLEKGEIVKIDVLDRLAKLLDTSIANLLGIEVEYYATASGFFERMRQLEEQSSRILSHFEPFSFLLTSPDYVAHLQQMIAESSPSKSHDASVTQLLNILNERKKNLSKQAPEIRNIIAVQQIEKFLHLGLIGTLNLSSSKKMERILLARKEVIHLIESLEENAQRIQVAIVDEILPNLTFQIFYHQPHQPFSLAVSPFRLGELPNIKTGIASVSTSPEAIRLHHNLFEKLWQQGAKGHHAIDALKKIIERF